MKAVILAGGKGTRLSEETALKPKPMVEIGGMPVLWHIMKIYAAHGITDFVICCGYKGHMIKQYFASYFLQMSDITIDLKRNRMNVIRPCLEPWSVTLIDTGLETMTGGRLKRAREHVGGETFCFTYGDGLSDVNIGAVIEHHKRHGKLVTVTATRHVSRFGVLSVADGQVTRFAEKPVQEGSWMNSGFFVMEPAALDRIDGDDTVFEREPVERLVRDGELSAYQHDGFFAGMDSLRDKITLEELWNAGKAPWKVWADAAPQANEIGANA